MQLQETQPMWSGLPKVLQGFLLFGGTAFSIGTWNSRGLLCSNRQPRHQKLGALKILLGHTSIICLQETHGNCAEVDLFLSDLKSRFLIFHNPFLDPFFVVVMTPLRIRQITMISTRLETRLSRLLEE